MNNVNNNLNTKKIKEIVHCITHYQEPMIYSYQLNISDKDFTRLKKFVWKNSDILHLNLNDKQIDELAKKILFIVQEESTINIEILKTTIKELTEENFPLNKSGMLTKFIELYKYNS